MSQVQNGLPATIGWADASAKVQTDRIRLHTHAIQAIQPILQLTYSDLPDFCSRTQSLQSPAIQARDSYDWDNWWGCNSMHPDENLAC